jgi:hypothetical protein
MCQVAYTTPYVTDAQQIEVMEKACEDGGDPAFCNEYGVQPSLGDRMPKDEDRGHRYIVRACDVGEMSACRSLADTLLSDPRCGRG